MAAGTDRSTGETRPPHLTRPARAVGPTRRVRLLRTGALVAAAVVSTVFVGPATAVPATGVHAEGVQAAEDTRAAHTATRRALEAAVEQGVPGAVATVRDGSGGWSGDAGVADRTTGRERGAQDRYRVGSITKTFVATVLLQLEAEGRLSLDDTVDSWLPGVVSGHGHDGRTITVRQLLNHTSGIFSYTSDREFAERIFGDGFLEHRYETWRPLELVKIAMGHQPDFAAGTSWRYSNTNYVLAGMVVEKVTGRSYGTEIERRILRPLNLRATSVPGTDVTVPRPSGRAYSTLESGDGAEPDVKIHDVTELNPTIAGAAGAMISNSVDLNRFYSALLAGELLPAKQFEEMTDTVATGDQGPAGQRYGLGLIQQRTACGKEVWGHSGGIHGSTSIAVTTRDGRHSIALNFNADWTGNAGKVVDAEFCG
ncbi:serine hydrolase domain-containing protein [Streptomyces sp. NPDC088116]|uniref:serine hydrolase domain-containing protein n=1 Tax=Streptomyces sp. NPDC088116 TaxID=3365825 RepID=UPI00382937A2